MDMYFLLLDTSLSGLAVGLVQRKKQGTDTTNSLLGSITLPVRNQAFTGLSQEVIALIGKNHLNLEDIGGLVTGVGPGSFTGIRIGMAFIQGLMAGRQCLGGSNFLVKGVSSLEALGRWYLKSVESHCKHLVIFPSTTTHAYISLAEKHSNQGVATHFSGRLVSIKELIEKDGIFMGTQNSPIEITVIENNIPSFSTALKQGGIVFRIKSAQDVLPEIILALKASIGEDFPLGFKTDLPVADYARLSTAEERAAT